MYIDIDRFMTMSMNIYLSEQNTFSKEERIICVCLGVCGFVYACVCVCVQCTSSVCESVCLCVSPCGRTHIPLSSLGSATGGRVVVV